MVSLDVLKCKQPGLVTGHITICQCQECSIPGESQVLLEMITSSVDYVHIPILLSTDEPAGPPFLCLC